VGIEQRLTKAERAAGGDKPILAAIQDYKDKTHYRVNGEYFTEEEVKAMAETYDLIWVNYVDDWRGVT
jgi:hypothetical protein